MLNKEHSFLQGIQKAISIKSSLNLGLPENLKQAFPNIIPMENRKNFIHNTIHNNLHPE
jgi:hypothetical protein